MKDPEYIIAIGASADGLEEINSFFNHTPAYHDFATLSQYYDFLKSAPEEIEALSKNFLISVTAFFRDKEAFDYIQNNVIPGILKKLVPNEQLKFWVAGCATGEDVYSLAMLIAEQLTRDLVFLPYNG